LESEKNARMVIEENLKQLQEKLEEQNLVLQKMIQENQIMNTENELLKVREETQLLQIRSKDEELILQKKEFETREEEIQKLKEDLRIQKRTDYESGKEQRTRKWK